MSGGYCYRHGSFTPTTAGYCPQCGSLPATIPADFSSTDAAAQQRTWCDMELMRKICEVVPAATVASSLNVAIFTALEEVKRLRAALGAVKA